MLGITPAEPDYRMTKLKGNVMARVQASEEMLSRRVRKGIRVDLEAMDLAKGAWLWAYENRVTDAPSFGDWVNEAIARHHGADPVEGKSSSEWMSARMYWIDKDKLDLLGDNAGRVFRGAVAAAAEEIVTEARTRGVEIRPLEGRLPSKVWRKS